MEIEIIGCRGRIDDMQGLINKIRQFGEARSIACQIMNADMVYGREHIVSAVEHAVRAFKNGASSCKTLDMEILLYASGKRQIKDAIDFMGAGRSGRYVFVSAGKTGIDEYNGKAERNEITKLIEGEGLKIDDTVINGDISTIEKFGISKEEMKTVDKSMYGDLILEKVAMVDLIK